MLLGKQNKKQITVVVQFFLWFIYIFSNQFDFCFRLFQIMIMNTRQRRNKNQTSLKKIKPRKPQHNKTKTKNEQPFGNFTRALLNSTNLSL